jgi:opacity protein-like surface antigen
MAGVSYPLMDHLLVDIGYRYINLGMLPSIASPSGQVVDKTMDAHEVRVGLRYMID